MEGSGGPRTIRVAPRAPPPSAKQTAAMPSADGRIPQYPNAPAPAASNKQALHSWSIWTAAHAGQAVSPEPAPAREGPGPLRSSWVLRSLKDELTSWIRKCCFPSACSEDVVWPRRLWRGIGSKGLDNPWLAGFRIKRADKNGYEVLAGRCTRMLTQACILADAELGVESQSEGPGEGSHHTSYVHTGATNVKRRRSKIWQQG